MAKFHHLILTHGREIARTLVAEDEIPALDLAARILEEESRELGITYSGFCLTGLPHRALKDDQPYVKSNGPFTLMISPGHILDKGKAKPIGVPFGPKARLILIYLQTQALRENSREVEVGRSLHAWMQRMDIAACGKNYATIRDQANRLARCPITFQWQGEGAEIFRNDHIVSGGISFRDDGGQGSLWQDTVQLGEAFFAALKAHPVPVWEPAIRALAQKSLALDIYVWLAYRLHSLNDPKPISWAALYDQFGGGYKAARQFRPEFLKALDFALAAYPDAGVERNETGLLLLPSRPPIPERLIGR